MKKSHRAGKASALLLLICLAAGLLLLQACGAKPPVDLASATWLVLGPFYSDPASSPWTEGRGFSHDYLADLGGEAGARLEEGSVFDGRTVTPVTAENGTVDLLQLFPGAANSVAYAYIEFTSSKEGKAALKLGSDDGARVWCNGRLLWSHHVFRPLTPEEDAIQITLEKGVNRLLLKIDQGEGGWGFSARLRTLAEERKEWTAQKSRELEIVAPRAVFPAGEQVWCAVSTRPSLLIDAEVELTASDSVGRLLCGAQGRIGEPIPLQIPPGFTGILRLRASGKGGHAGIGSGTAVAFYGDGAAMAKETAARARAAAAKLKAADDIEDAGATLELLADQLEGKLHPSLATAERNLRAVDDVFTILETLKAGPWKTAALKGLRQWAYRSRIDDSCQPYTTWVPRSYDPAKRYPLIVALHGHSEDDYKAAKKLGDLGNEEFIVLAPFGRGDMGYRSMGEQDVLDVLERVQRVYSIDEDRIYLMGTSMGGMGAWRLGQFFADRFAAMASFCGWTGTEYLENLRHLPVLIVHGSADATVPAGMDREAAARLKELGYAVRFDELPGVDHGAWEAWAAKNGGDRIFEFFRAYKRDPWPRDLTLVMKNYLRYGGMYWLRVLDVNGRDNRVQAEVAGPREVKISCRGISALSLDLRHPALARDGEISIAVNGSEIKVPAGKTAGIGTKDGTEWKLIKPSSGPYAPHLGGGLADMFHGPLVFVYGTTRPSRKALLKNAAERFADMRATPEIPVGSKAGRFAVVSDLGIGARALSSCSLFLFGNVDENLVTRAFMARWAGTIPVRLNGNDVSVNGRLFKNCGIVLTYPNPLAPDRLVTIATLPFKAAEVAAYTGFANVPIRGYRGNASAVECTTYVDAAVMKSLSEPVTDAWVFNRDWTKLLPFKP